MKLVIKLIATLIITLMAAILGGCIFLYITCDRDSTFKLDADKLKGTARSMVVKTYERRGLGKLHLGMSEVCYFGNNRIDGKVSINPDHSIFRRYVYGYKNDNLSYIKTFMASDTYDCSCVFSYNALRILIERNVYNTFYPKQSKTKYYYSGTTLVGEAHYTQLESMALIDSYAIKYNSGLRVAQIEKCNPSGFPLETINVIYDKQGRTIEEHVNDGSLLFNHSYTYNYGPQDERGNWRRVTIKHFGITQQVVTRDIVY